MAHIFFDKVRMTTATTGTGTITLSSAFDASFMSLVDAMTEQGAVDGDTTDFIIEDGGDIQVVVGGVIGGSGTTVTRGSGGFSQIGGVYGSSNLDLSGTAQLRFYPAAASLNALLPKAGGTMTGTLTLSGDGSSALHAVTKQQLDAAAVNAGRRQRVRAATTANITIATALNDADTLDGVTLATGDLVLVKNQSAPEENGIYVVGASPARSGEFDTYNEHAGALVTVAEGTAGADTVWLCTSNEGGTLDTTAIAFSAFTALDATSLGAAIYGATGKTTPVDADELPLIDSAASNVLKKLTWANLKAALKTTASNIWVGTNDVLFMTAKNAADSNAFVTLTSSTTIATDCSTGYNFFVTLDHNTTFGAPSNPIDGRTYQWLIQQGSTGGTGAFNSVFEFAATPTLSVGSGKRDLVVATYHSASGKFIASFRKAA